MQRDTERKTENNTIHTEKRTHTHAHTHTHTQRERFTEDNINNRQQPRHVSRVPEAGHGSLDSEKQTGFMKAGLLHKVVSLITVVVAR